MLLLLTINIMHFTWLFLLNISSQFYCINGNRLVKAYSLFLFTCTYMYYMCMKLINIIKLTICSKIANRNIFAWQFSYDIYLYHDCFTIPWLTVGFDKNWYVHSHHLNERPKGHRAQPKMHDGIGRAGVTFRNCKVKKLIMERGNGKDE